MPMPKSVMFMAPLMIAAGMVSATSAGAADRLTDVSYMNAARCAGLIEGSQGDVAPYKTVLDAQRAGRESYVQDKSEEIRLEAQREVRRANPAAKQKIAAELEGACKAYVGGSRVTAG